jgi:hypothetical protein
MYERKKSRLAPAIIGSIAVLIVVGLFAFDLWFGLFSIAISWVIADFVLSLVMRGGGGIVQLPPVSGTEAVTKGRAYLAFLILDCS